ncbi:MAG: hypothetical protein L6R39_003469, partial [Caloplaca ligustica]
MLLTPLGLLHLAKKGHFIDVSDYDIKDKSKANVLAKGLVLLQIAWSMLQCFSRKATGLPISLLEVHTLVHAGCAVVMYGLWFHKPMDVEEPIVISTAEFASEIALMLVRNQGSGVQPVGNLVIPTQFKSACYQGPTYRAWPGRQAAEASYLVFDPSKGQRSESLSDADNTPVTHTTGLGEGQQAPKQEGLRDNNCSLEDQHPTAAESHVSSPKNPSNPIQEAACVSTISGTTFSQEQAKAVSASIENQGDRLLNYFNPGYNERRKARYQHKSPRLLDPGLPKEVNGCDVWTGFHSTPPRGVPTQLAVFTGDTGPGGIGPNAFMIGSWKGQTDQGLNKDRIAVLEVPETLRRWLPPGKLRRSSISFCCLLKISLSRKDIHRWELAGTALYDEHRTANARVHEVQRFVDISGPVGSSHHAYFVSHTASTASSVLEEMYAVDPGEADRPVLVLQGIYRRLANNVGFRWTSTLAALVTTAFLYAALHLALWNYQFPTTAEKLLWRISASTLLAIPTLLFSGLCTSAMYKRIAAIVLVAQSKRRAKQQRTPDRRPGSINCPPVAVPNLNINAEEAPTTAPTSNENDDIHSDFRYPTDTESILVALGAFGVYLVALLYLLARSFIIVESFLSLRHVPIGVYAGVGWSKYIPHL